MGAVDDDAQTVELAAEALEHVLEVALGGDADVVGAAAAAFRRVQQSLDLLLRRVGELLPVRVEELDAVVLGWVVRRRDDDAQVERQQRHGGSRKHARQDRVPTGCHDAATEGLLELGP